jgi:hypothetical protein
MGKRTDKSANHDRNGETLEFERYEEKLHTWWAVPVCPAESGINIPFRDGSELTEGHLPLDRFRTPLDQFHRRDVYSPVRGPVPTEHATTSTTNRGKTVDNRVT